MMLDVNFNLRVKPTVIKIVSEWCITFSCICLSWLLDSSIDFGFIDYMVVNIVERTSSIYHCYR